MNRGSRSRSVRRLTSLAGVATLVTGFGAAVATSPVHAAPISPAAKAGPAAERVPARQWRQARHPAHLRQRPLLPGQPERAVRPAADAEPAELLRGQRHVPVQQPHAADRAHRRRHPDHVHRPVRRPARACRSPTATEAYNTGRHDRPGRLVRLLDRPDLRHRRRPERRATTPTRRMVYSADPAGHRAEPAPKPDTTTPAPWVPFTRAGLRRRRRRHARTASWRTPAVDIPKVFGANSPEAQQLAADPDSFKDPETADYVGIAVHCAQGNAFCATPRRVKFGQTSPDARPPCADLLPDEPGGYTGYQALFGHRYVAPQLGAGTPNLTHNGYQVTNAAGQPRRPERQPDQRRVPDQPPRASPASARSTRRRPWPTWPTCRRPASR